MNNATVKLFQGGLRLRRLVGLTDDVAWQTAARVQTETRMTPGEYSVEVMLNDGTLWEALGTVNDAGNWHAGPFTLVRKEKR